jgi:hypothetical protein
MKITVDLWLLESYNNYSTYAAGTGAYCVGYIIIVEEDCVRLAVIVLGCLLSCNTLH